MQLSLLLAKQIISMALIVLLGCLLVKKGFFDEKATSVIAKLNLSIIAPCAIFHSFQMEFSMEKLTGLGAAFLAAILIHILFIAAEFILRKPCNLSPVESVSVINTNGLNLILPLIMATLDSEMIFYCSAFVVVQTIILWTYGLKLISGEPKIHLKSLLNPNIVAILLGFLFFLCHITFPEILDTSIKNIGDMVGPLSMLVIGMLMGPLDLKKAFGNIRVYLTAFIRLILFPILSVLLIRYSGLLNIHPMAEQIYLVTMLAAASCSAASIPQMAQVYGKDAESANYSSMLNVVILAFSIVTLPFIIYIYQMIL